MHPFGGRVVLEESDQGKQVFFATARFSRSADRVLLEGCSDVPLESGSCCFLPDPGPGPGGTGGGGVSAGSIAITHDGAALGQLSFERDGYTPLVDPPTNALSWNAGDMLKVTATGDLVDAFSGSVVAPQPPTILSLPEPHGSVLSLSLADASAKATYYTWAPSGTAGAKILLLLRDVQTGTLKCLADDSAGVVGLPPQLVASSFNADDSGYLNIGRISTGQASENVDVEIASFSVVEWGFLFTK
jgi:hypothetical protein